MNPNAGQQDDPDQAGRRISAVVVGAVSRAAARPSVTVAGRVALSQQGEGRPATNRRSCHWAIPRFALSALYHSARGAKNVGLIVRRVAGGPRMSLLDHERYNVAESGRAAEVT